MTPVNSSPGPIRPCVRGFCLAALLLAGCRAALPGEAAVPSQGSSAPIAAPLTFAWRAPCRVPVEVRSEQRRTPVRFGFELVVRRDPSGALDLRIEDPRVLEIMGEDVGDPEAQRALAPVMAATTLSPGLRVSARGEYLGLRELDAAIEQVLAYRATSDAPEAHARLAATLRSPTTRDALAADMRDLWALWVGAWIGLQLAPGEVAEFPGTLELGELILPVTQRYEHRGSIAADPSRVALALTSRFELTRGVDATLAEAFGRLAEDYGLRVPQGDLARIGLRREASIAVDTDPRTLRPNRARMEVVVAVHDGELTRTGREVQEYRFDWARAEGCR